MAQECHDKQGPVSQMLSVCVNYVARTRQLGWKCTVPILHDTFASGRAGSRNRSSFAPRTVGCLFVGRTADKCRLLRHVGGIGCTFRNGVVNRSGRLGPSIRNDSHAWRLGVWTYAIGIIDSPVRKGEMPGGREDQPFEASLGGLHWPRWEGKRSVVHCWRCALKVISA